MSPESLETIASANAQLASFLNQASALGFDHGHPDDIFAAIEPQLPAITATLEKVSRTLRPSMIFANLDGESKTQLDLYAQNLRRLKSVLSRLLSSAEKRRRQLRDNSDMAHEMTSWLRTLQMTKID